MARRGAAIKSRRSLRSVVLWGAAMPARAGSRAVDFLAAVLLSRLTRQRSWPRRSRSSCRGASARSAPSIGLAIGVVIALVGVVFQITWLRRGFRTSTSAARAACAVFIAALVVAEIISRRGST
ncbi:MAG: hypothetical protein U0235_26055 [Polyangiaceae bacterium]